MNNFTIPDTLAQRIAREARLAGAKLVETGGFVLTGHARPPILALAGDAGVHREEKLFVIDTHAIATLFDWATEHEVTVLTQWHSHRYEAFLSETDLAHGFNVPGFRTSVIPNYENPSSNPAGWGWWQFQHDGWTPIAAPATNLETFTTITFEAGDVTEH